MEEFLEEDMVAIGWSTLGDLSEADKQEIHNLFEEEYPDDDPRASGLRVGYIDRFVNKMDEGDTVLVPRYGNVYVGEVAGRYEYKGSLSADYAHQRQINWKYNKSAIDGQKAPQKIHKKLYPGTVSHTVQDLDDEKAVETFLKQSAGAEKTRYFELLQDGELYGINKKTIEEAMLTVFQQYYPTMRNAGTRGNAEGDTDLIAEDLPGDLTVRIQIKHYGDDSLGTDPIDQLAKSMDDGDKGIVATVGQISSSTEKYAANSEYEISLVDGWEFTELVFEHRTQFSRSDRRLLGLDSLPQVT
ncbi:restriction endonuclease [Halomicrobium salinisoli]|uniref:restriction endonuclease n=1 Tax=Halomicrobium salinisoli TaxID=2878391 RepID=UPI001CEFE89C|nr:restriction endonuclease [Halomicrobium salinisoli]